MTDQQDGFIIKSDGIGLERASKPASPISSRMASDMISRYREKQTAQKRIQLGDHSFLQPDYRQILKWARAFSLSPEALVGLLAESSECCQEGGHFGFQSTSFSVVSGSIYSLCWPLNDLPFLPNEWEPGIRIRLLGIHGEATSALHVSGKNLTDLTQLDCSNCNLKGLKLDNIPSLKRLDFSGNNIDSASISILDTPNIEILDAGWNNLTGLDLNGLTNLRILDCSGNNIDSLDLKPSSKLEELFCSENTIKQLDLHHTPYLKKLWCFENELTELDLRYTPSLDDVNCARNRLNKIHTHADRPRITSLWDVDQGRL